MKRFSALVVACLTGCATTTVTQFSAPDGTAVKTVKCVSDQTKCFTAATQSCPGEGTYRVVSSASRAGGLAADVIPGPFTWYYMSYSCGPSDGKMPQFPFTGERYVPPPVVVQPSTPSQPTTTNCTTIGNNTTCRSY